MLSSLENFLQVLGHELSPLISQYFFRNTDSTTLLSIASATSLTVIFLSGTESRYLVA